MNIVNFVRGIEPRCEMDLYTPVAKQVEYNRQAGIPCTFLLQYDALVRPDFQKLFSGQTDDTVELGVWFENCRELIESIGLPWRGREGYDWDWYVNVGFLPGYTPSQREMIIDRVFDKFKECFGAYPQVAGSWLLDAYSMDYMCRKYGMKAFCICREQYAVDAYTLWGGYSSGGYYPSKNNMLCPAQCEENQISAPVFRMLMADPIYNYDGEAKGYGVCTLEPVWKPGQTPDVVDWYLEAYYNTPCLSHAQATTGQENSFGWDMIGPGYLLQADKLAALEKKGGVQLQKLGDTGAWYKNKFPLSAAAAQVAEQDWRGDGRKAAWYNCRNYRAGVIFENNSLVLRDIMKFDDRYQERYLEKACPGWLADYDNLPVIDARMWGTADAPCGLFLQKEVKDVSFDELSETTLQVRLQFTDGTKGSLIFNEEKLLFENCGDVLYRPGVPGENTRLACEHNKLRFEHCGFDYAVELEAAVNEETGQIRLSPAQGRVCLQMNIK